MKPILIALLFLFTKNVTYAQNQNFFCSRISGKTTDTILFNKDKLVLTFNADTKNDLLKFLKASTITSTAKKTFEVMGQDIATKNGKKLDNLIELVNAAKPNGPFKISFLPTDSSFTVNISCDGLKADIIPFALKNEKSKETVDLPKNDLPFEPIIFVSEEMIRSIQNSVACNLCDERNDSLKEISLDGRKDRKFSTDYIVTFDPMLKNDAYTICKHFFGPL